MESIGRLESRLDFLVDFLVHKRRNYSKTSTESDSSSLPYSVFAYFRAAYEKKTGHKCSTTVGQGVKNAQVLLRAHNDKTIKQTIDSFFAYEKRVSYAWNKFVAKFDEILPYAVGEVKNTGYARARCPECGMILDEGHAPDCPTRRNA